MVPKNTDKLDLTGKTAIVTGGSRGIGKKTAADLAEAGANIVIVDILEEKGKEAAEEIKEIGTETLFCKTDITKVDEIEAMVSEVKNKFEKIDILVNAAGINVRSRPEDVKEEDWDKILDVNLKGLFFCCQKVGEVMIEQEYGKIVNISSIQGEEVLPLRASYAASKGGVKQVSKSMAVEWAKYNINVNVVAPAFVRTPMVEKVLADDTWGDVIINKTPMRRPCEPQEVADTILFLVSDMASYITGHTLLIDGGWTAGYAVDGV